MRIKAGWTLEDTFNALSDEQRDAVAEVEQARDSEAAAIRAALNVAREAVRRALAAGVPAHVLADRLGVSRARVYQMRDEAQTYYTEQREARA